MSLLLACAAPALIVAAQPTASGSTTGSLLRNSASPAGPVFVGARFFGAGLAWAAPLPDLGLVGAAMIYDRAPKAAWLWVLPDAPGGRALAVALPFILAGSALVGAFGPRTATLGKDTV